MRTGEGVVRGDPALVLLVIFEEGRVDDPEKLPRVGLLGIPGAVLRDQSQALAEVQAQVGEHGVHQALLAELEEQDVPGLRPRGRVDRLSRLLRDRLGQWALRPLAVLAHLRPRQAARSHALGDLFQLVDLRAGEVRAGRHFQGLDDLTGRDGGERLPHGHPAAPVLRHEPGQVDVLHAKAQVGLVVAVLAHRLLVRHARKRLGDRNAQDLAPERGDQLLHRGEDVVLGDERHLQVDLGELRLPIDAQVLVPEALDDLEVALEPGDHEELLEQLRTLRQRIELPRVQAGGHEKVPGAARRVLDQVRRLQLQEAEPVQRLTRDGVHLAALDQRPLQRRPPQVEVAVVEPLFLGGVDLVLDQEGRRLAPVEDGELVRVHLDLAGNQTRVQVVSAGDHLSAHADAVLVAQLLGEVVQVLAGVRLEHHLGEPGAVAQVDEHGAAVIAAVVHPAEEDHFLAHVLGGQLAAGMRALQIADEFGHVLVPPGGAPVSTNPTGGRACKQAGARAFAAFWQWRCRLSRAWDASSSPGRPPVPCCWARACFCAPRPRSVLRKRRARTLGHGRRR